jgi:HD superfamily phosphodiesterase
MNNKLKEKLITIAKERITKDDPSHDIEHALRVMKNAEYIARKERADSAVCASRADNAHAPAWISRF